MSIIQRKGRAVIEHLAKEKYFSDRRMDVEHGWGVYLLDVTERVKQNDETPYKYGFELLSEETGSFVRREAQRWARSCRKYRIYEDDFKSHFRFTVLKAALKHYSYEKKGAFFDLLRTAIRNAGRDLVRNALTKKNRINHLALSLSDEKTAREADRRRTHLSAEDEAIPRLIVEQMATDTSLTEQERKLFEFLRSAPDATLQEMADALGVRDRKQASRIKDRLANKLRKYIEE